MSTSHQTDTVYCHKCGHPNASWRATCENCSAQLISVASSPPMNPYYSRPLGVALYIVFTVMVKVASLLSSVGSLSWLMLVLILGQIVAAAGVWQMKQWGRKLFLLLMPIGIGLSLLVVLGYSQMINSSILIGSLVGAMVDLLFLYCLATNGHRFQA